MDNLMSRQVLDLWDRYKPTIAVDAIEYDRELKQLLGTNLASLGADLISRQAAINAIDECYCGGEDSCGEPWIYQENAVEAIQMIEPIQPEIIRCKDCRYYNSEEKECLDLLGHGRRWEENDFCSYAERGEVTT